MTAPRNAAPTTTRSSGSFRVSPRFFGSPGGAQGEDVFGLGAGFGGCLVAIVERDCVDRFGVQVAAAYAEATGIAPSVFGVEAAPGAGPVLIG